MGNLCNMASICFWPIPSSFCWRYGSWWISSAAGSGPRQAAALIALAVQLFLLMLHKSFGGFQFGLRYTADLIPCALAYFVLSGRHRRVRWGEAALMAAALAFFAIGALCVHI